MRVDLEVVKHSARTAIGAVASFLIAHQVRMPEAYWAAISTIIVMQSTWGASLRPSWQRFVGTVLGAATGALLSTYFGPNLAAFGVGIFALGILTLVLKTGPAYRFAGVTLAITMLIPRNAPAWGVAEHRLVEVSVGILVALLISALWPSVEPSFYRSS